MLGRNCKLLPSRESPGPPWLASSHLSCPSGRGGHACSNEEALLSLTALTSVSAPEKTSPCSSFPQTTVAKKPVEFQLQSPSPAGPETPPTQGLTHFLC